MESIVSAAALLADADCTRNERRERIVAECNGVRQALQDLLTQQVAQVSYLNSAYSGVSYNLGKRSLRGECLNVAVENEYTNLLLLLILLRTLP